MIFEDGEVVLVAKHPELGRVASGLGRTLEDAVTDLLSMFVEMQHATIEAMRQSGLVRYADEVPPSGQMS